MILSGRSWVKLQLEGGARRDGLGAEDRSTMNLIIIGVSRSTAIHVAICGPLRLRDTRACAVPNV